MPVDGAPVVFATAYAHDAVLHLKSKDGTGVDLSARPDPIHGGFAVSLPSDGPAAASGTANLQAQWGFDRYEGPGFTLADPHAQVWRLAPGDSADLVAGRTQTLHLRAESASCLDEVTLVDSATDRKSTRLNSSHSGESRMPSSA